MGALMNKPVIVFDSEIYVDYYLAAFRNVETGETFTFEKYPGNSLDTATINKLLKSSTIVSFNGNHFDMPLLSLALIGATNEHLKRGTDAIINGGLKSWQFEKQFRVTVPVNADHIDLFEVAPGMASLKIYGGRLHCPKMQDLPFEPSASIAPEQRALLREYCGNDLSVTEQLYRRLLPQIELRERMGAVYKLDLRSKSDAQIAEAVICQEVSEALGREVERPTVRAGTRFRYIRPSSVEFTSPTMRDIVSLIDSLEFTVPESGKVELPKELSERDIVIGGSTYRMGIGGLHSTEKNAAHLADDDTILIDRDVISYYPKIILNTGLAPAHMGAAFGVTYRGILDRRIEAKRAGDKVIADSLKVVVVSSFGKMGSKWSKLYSPNLMIQTTVTGQLSLLMLIEALEANGIPVVSANTDGVVIKCPVSQISRMNFLVADWELATGFETEAVEYRALYSRDVNNYVAIKKDGGLKLKGAYAPVGLQKNPANEICTAAAVKYLVDGTPVEKTITECQDVRKFVSVRQVKGGAVSHGRYLGKAVRWYYSIAAIGAIQYKVNGYVVPRSEGALPLMELPDAVPADIDFDWYINEAHSILQDIGAEKVLTPKAAAGMVENITLW